MFYNIFTKANQQVKADEGKYTCSLSHCTENVMLSYGKQATYSNEGCN